MRSRLFKFRYKYSVNEIDYKEWVKTEAHGYSFSEDTDYILLTSSILDTHEDCVEKIMDKLYKKGTYEIIKESIKLKTLNA